jgi:hypothetical protein
MEIFFLLDKGAISIQKYRAVHGGGASRKDAKAQRGNAVRRKFVSAFSFAYLHFDGLATIP